MDLPCPHISTHWTGSLLDHQLVSSGPMNGLTDIGRLTLKLQGAHEQGVTLHQD